MIVIDASLAAKLVLDEHDSADVDRWYLNVDEEIAAPDLIMIEVAQAVVRRVNARQTTREIGQRAVGAWRTILESGGISLHRTTASDVEAASALAMAIGHPVKDCIYLALAKKLEGQFVTADARFASKARSLHTGVSLLSELG